jgi:hypothetical protein
MEVIYSCVTKIRFNQEVPSTESILSSEGGSVETPYALDPRWLLVERILVTPDFERSPRLADFLRHICKLTLEGQDGSISEQYLGEVLFGRPPEYDSSADTIVRSHALRLRRKLEQYFLRAGRDEPLRLVIPRGAYVPVFISASEVDSDVSAPEQTLPGGPALLSEKIVEPQFAAAQFTALPRNNTEDYPSVRRYRIALAASLALSLVLAIAFVMALRSARHARARTERNHLLWSRLFTAEEPTQIVLGDSGLVLFHAAARQYVSLQDYVSGDLSKQMPYVQHVEPEFARFLAGRRYTSFVDAATLVRLLRMPEATPDRTLVHFSRDMQLDDFKNGNIIMIGAQEANPWVELFERSMDFVFTIDTPGQHSAFLNRHPLAGEQSSYSCATPATASKVYAVVAFLPNLNANGNVLLLEGISMAGTEAAVDLVMDDQRFLPLLRAMRRADGSLPHFEMLLESDNLKDSAGPARVVALHIHPA